MIMRSRRWKLALGAAALFAAGAGSALLFMRPRTTTVTREEAVTTPADHSSMPSAVIVEIPADVAARAGFVETEVKTVRLPSTTRIPGTVEPNAYTVIPGTAPAGGRVLRVLRQLGDPVAAGSAVAVIQSPDLARAATDQAAAAAALTALERDLERTRKLVAIGAASRRELEDLEAQRAAAQGRVEAARAEVRLLGGSASHSGEMTVRAGSSGVVTERAANPGEVIERGAAIVTTAALSPVWVIGELAEADLGRVRVGDSARVESDAFPGLSIAGRVTYIAPEVRRETRTAQIRIETPNEGGRLRFGMLVEARIESSVGGSTLAVPSAAIQRVGSATVVYVVTSGSRSRFEERHVEIGIDREGMTEIRSGLREGERIISTGSFFVRAEIERQGLRATPPAPAPSTAPTKPATVDAVPRVIPINVDSAGFSPAQITLKRDERVILRFTRVAESCATEVIVPPSAQKHTLPLNKSVDIPFVASRAGEVTFTCGMNMLKGTLVVR